MRRLLGMVFAFGLGLAVMALAFNFHFVKTEADWFIVRKQEVRIGDFFADVRKWDRAEWDKHPELQESLTQAGHDEIIPQTPQPADVIDLFRSGRLRPMENAQRESQWRRR